MINIIYSEIIYTIIIIISTYYCPQYIYKILPQVNYKTSQTQQLTWVIHLNRSDPDWYHSRARCVISVDLKMQMSSQPNPLWGCRRVPEAEMNHCIGERPETLTAFKAVCEWDGWGWWWRDQVHWDPLSAGHHQPGRTQPRHTAAHLHHIDQQRAHVRLAIGYAVTKTRLENDNMTFSILPFQLDIVKNNCKLFKHNYVKIDKSWHRCINCSISNRQIEKQQHINNQIWELIAK